VKIEGAFLRSRVARRTFTLFICCAILPLTAMAAVSYTLVTGHLREQSRRQMHQAAKTIGLSFFERLLFLEAGLKRAGAATRAADDPFGSPSTEARDEFLGKRFKSLTLLRAADRQALELGPPDPPLEFGPEERRELLSDRAVVFGRFHQNRPPQLFMARRIGAPTSDMDVLVGEIDMTYLWGNPGEEPFPLQTEVCAFEDPGRVFMCTMEVPRAALEQATLHRASAGGYDFGWERGGEEYVASVWTLFLRSSLSGPSWTVMVSQAKADVFAPIASFKRVFFSVVALALSLVVFFSTGQIQRSLGPLEKLQEGTRRISEQAFDSRVDVKSGDEFEDLAASFNTMAHRLGRQFHALSTTAEVTQIVLSSLDTRRIAEMVLLRMRDICPCDRVGMVLAQPEGTAGVLFVGGGAAKAEIREHATAFTPEDLGFLRAHSKMAMRSARETPVYLAPLGSPELAFSVILPVFLGERLAGVIALGYLDSAPPDPEDLDQARQLADQVAVALANARLVDELDQLNWGTLTALARAIDAKSHWTAGHSERVTQLALRIGQHMGLSKLQLDVLHRGGLLHDIGKIGIPPEILDKPGKLDPEELRVMRGHAQLGARILEPITAYAEVIPIVRHHHECFDGTGYPEGLAGEAISLGARIFAVADVYDALRSNRPYRAGMPQAQVVEYIRKGSGRQFDPRVVEVFLGVMEEESPDREAAAPVAQAI
jgi:putative nucleotidyltransferase with HDIG domain